MGKDPAFLFYPNDYLGGTMGFSIEMHGLYILALIFQFNNGHFSGDQINSILQNRFSEIEHKFKKDAKGLYYNERIDIEKERRHDFVESRRKNARNYLSNKDKPLINTKIDTKHMGLQKCMQMYPHMENENEDENKDINIKSEEGVRGEKEKTWKTDYQTYYDECNAAFDKLLADWSWIRERKEYHPGIRIRKSTEKMFFDYWGTQAGWKKKKSAKIKDIDWTATVNNGLTMKCNQVWLQKGETDDELEFIRMMESRANAETTR